MPSLFRPEVETPKLTTVPLRLLDSTVQQVVLSRFGDVEDIELTPRVFLNGTKYCIDMFLSVGNTSGLPNFGKIIQIGIVSATHVCFILEPFTAHYVKHLRSYHLKKSLSPSLLVQKEELNDYIPLVAYFIRGCLLMTPRTFLLK